MQHDPFSVQSRMLMRQNVNKDFTNGRLKPKHLTAVVKRSRKDLEKCSQSERIRTLHNDTIKLKCASLLLASSECFSIKIGKRKTKYM